MTSSLPDVIALVGFMGSGKTTIGKLLAERLGRVFVDLDTRIEESTGMSIPDYFKNFGEPKFRAIEAETLGAEIGKGRAVVLACGGGIVENQDNRSTLTGCCMTIWLDIPEAELIRRLRDDHSGRPMLSGDLESRIKLLFARRYSLYESTAGIRHSWESGETASATVDAITARLEAIAGKLL